MSTMGVVMPRRMLSRCRTAACGQKKSRQTSCLLEDCGLRAWKVLRDDMSPYHEHVDHARNATKENRAALRECEGHE